MQTALIELLLDEMWNEMSHSLLTYGILKDYGINGVLYAFFPPLSCWCFQAWQVNKNLENI